MKRSYQLFMLEVIMIENLKMIVFDNYLEIMALITFFLLPEHHNKNAFV